MTRVAAPPAVDLVRIAEGGTWHILDEVVVRGDEPLAPGVVRTRCGQTKPAFGQVADEVDANVTRFAGSPVCGNCAALKTTAEESAEKEDEVTVATPEKKSTSRGRKPAAKSTTAKPEVKAVEKADLKAAIARAEQAISTQPKRTSAQLTPKQAEKAFKLGKAIAADRWLLKKAVAGKTSAATVAAMVERIEARVAERNKIREAKADA